MNIEYVLVIFIEYNKSVCPIVFFIYLPEACDHLLPGHLVVALNQLRKLRKHPFKKRH